MPLSPSWRSYRLVHAPASNSPEPIWFRTAGLPALRSATPVVPGNASHRSVAYYTKSAVPMIGNLVAGDLKSQQDREVESSFDEIKMPGAPPKVSSGPTPL